MAKTGLVAKGTIYCLIGAIAFMAAFEINGQSNNDTNKDGVFSLIQGQVAGQLLLGLLVLGLLCYCAWRMVQCFYDTEDKGSQTKGLLKRARYLLSGLIYLSFAIAAIKLLLHSGSKTGGDNYQQLVSELLSKPFGQYLAGIAAAVIAGVGIYQIVYGISGKYRKHVSGLQLKTRASSYLLNAGKIGYVARGTTWLITSWLMFKAAIHANPKDAGDTTKAFEFLERGNYGSLLLGLLGLGLVLYGIFNYVRARYEHFNSI